MLAGRSDRQQRSCTGPWALTPHLPVSPPQKQDWGHTHHRWYRYTRNTTSSLKQASRWEVGMVMMKANTSSMKVLKACGQAGP